MNQRSRTAALLLLALSALPLAGPAWAASQSVTLAAPGGNSAAIQLDTSKSPYVGILVNVPNGVTLTSGAVQVAGSVSGPWNVHDTLNGLSASANGNLQYPVSFVRMTGTVSGGSVTLTTIQQETKP